MASLRRHPKSPYYIACFTLPDGRRTTRTTKQTDRRKALKIALEYERASIEGKAQRLSEACARRVIQDIYTISNGASIQSTSIGTFATTWLRRKEGEIVAKSHMKYSSVIDSFLSFIGSRSDADIRSITKNTVYNFRDDILKRQTIGSANIALKILRTFFNDAQKEGLIDSNPAVAVPTIRNKSKHQRRPFTPDEINLLLKTADPEWQGMIYFGFYTGLRIGDIAQLTWRNVDLAQCELHVQTSKTGRVQLLPLHPRLSSWLKLFRKKTSSSSEALFPIISSTYRHNIHSGTLSNQFHKILVKAGLLEEKKHVGTGKGRSSKRIQNEISFHSFRHTTTSFLKRAGISDAVAKDLIGHESTAVSWQYTHMDMNTKRAAIETMPTLGL